MSEELLRDICTMPHKDFLKKYFSVKKEAKKEIPLITGAYITVEGKLKNIIPLAKLATEKEAEK